MKKILFFLLIFIYPSTSYSFNVNFTVSERKGIERSTTHIDYSIPIPKEENILTVDNLQIENQLAEFTVLSRYGGTPEDATKPIRVVLIDFLDNFAPNETKTYTLSTRATAAQEKNPIATEQTNYIEVNTGNAIFRISKSTGNLFDYVTVNGSTLIDSPKDTGMIVNVDGVDYTSYHDTPQVSIFRNNSQGCVITVKGSLKDKDGNLLKPPTPSLDKITPDSHVDYGFYYTFHKNSSFVYIDQTLKNNGRGWSRFAYRSVEHLYVNNWRTELKLTNPTGNLNVHFENFSEVYSTEEYSLKQDELNTSGFNNKTYDFSATLLKNDNLKLKTWDKYNSYAGISDSIGGIAIADKWFWQNYPSEYHILGNKITYNFLPTRDSNYSGYTPPQGYVAEDLPERYLDTGAKYRILGGMWKTHRTVYYFHTNSPTYQEVVASLQAPLIITLDPKYVGNTQFFNFMFDPNFISTYNFPANEKLQDSIDRWRNYAKSIWDPSYDHIYGKSFQTLREERGVPLWQWINSDGTKAYTYPSWYGWLRFGNSPRSLNFGFNSQHYDFTYQAYLVWQREIDYNVYDIFEEMVDHLADVITLHDPFVLTTNSLDDDILLNGAQRYELDSLGDNFTSRTYNINDPHVGNAHAWTRGVFIYYLLTGNPRYYEIMGQYFFHVQAAKDVGSASIETRDLTRLIGSAINYWQVTGDKQAITEALYIWNRLKNEGTQIGIDKFALDCRISSDKLWIGYDAMGIQYILRLYYALLEAGMQKEASDLRSIINKIAIWNKDMVMAAWPKKPGTYNSDQTEYYKFTTTNALFLNSSAAGDLSLDLPYHWDTEFYNANYSLSWCDLYAFMYRETGEQVWLNMARTAFKDRFMYNVASLTGQIESPQNPSWQSYGISPNIGSGTWKFGMAITKPLLYLQTEQWITAGWSPKPIALMEGMSQEK
ncbi:hypothetical protein [Desulfogranum japonicum]|uniref:hypothetical protein n=1 Tax=Desulfogranum japonicum TaxID=231447 RepID=UPI000409F222|nr:hypothetical protein [Desulfogranum japonicum]